MITRLKGVLTLFLLLILFGGLRGMGVSEISLVSVWVVTHYGFPKSEKRERENAVKA